MEPKFEIPLPPGPNWVTARGMRMTRETVAELEAVDMTAMDEEAAKKHKRLLRYWRTRLATASPSGTGCSSAVAFGDAWTTDPASSTRTAASGSSAAIAARRSATA